MTNLQKALSAVWLKAAVLGSVWASSEIILGSFFHNLRIPFSSIILTGIAITLVVSVSYRWKEKGLIWRAGLICAIMKSVSPSAIIFGPMIAILFASLLLEGALLLFGRNIIGFIAGGILAMSWNLFQKIANLLIYYGFNIVELYASLIEYAGRQLPMTGFNTWTPVIGLWLIYVFFGLLAAIAGIVIGKADPANRIREHRPLPSDAVGPTNRKRQEPFVHSFFWLGFTVAGMVGELTLMNLTGPVWWFIAGLALLITWVIKYHGILRPLKKPKFWIIFVLITMLSSLVLVRVQSDLTWFDGILAGLTMNFRAAVMMVGFSIIGKEMSNPVIRDLFIRSAFRQLPLALEVAFDTLPFALANMPSFSTIYKHPIRALQSFGAQTEVWLERLQGNPGRVIIISGKSGTGKTTLLSKIATGLSEAGIATAGILAPAVFSGDVKRGYDILNLADGRSMSLARTEAQPGMEQVGRFWFFPAAVDFGREALKSAGAVNSTAILIDEIGPWELEGKGWAGNLTSLMTDPRKVLVIAVRESLVEQVIANWQIREPLIFYSGKAGHDETVQQIVNLFQLK
jgi:nucleoside-triphosphatase THEP1